MSHGLAVMTASLIAAAVSVAAIPTDGASASDPSASPSRLARLETLVFRTSIDAFVETAARRSGQDATFDWSTDFCSAPLVGSTGRSFDFSSACRRHDFAYRNYKRADLASSQRGRLWNSETRHRIDLRFRQDMKRHCANRSAADMPTCLGWAELFFRMVRIAGGP